MLWDISKRTFIKISSKYIFISTSKSKRINVTDSNLPYLLRLVSRSKAEFWIYRYDLYLREIIRYYSVFQANEVRVIGC